MMEHHSPSHASSHDFSLTEHQYREVAMNVREAVSAFQYSILDLAPGTQRWYMQKLRVFTTWCERENLTLEMVKPAEVRRYLAYIKTLVDPRTNKPFSSSTLKSYLQIVRTLLRFCRQEEEFEAYVTERTAQHISMPKVEIDVIEIFTPEQIQALFAACEAEHTETLAMRNKAILSVLLDTGIRASELCDLTLDQVFLSPEDSFLRVRGKGRKEREAGPLGKHARRALQRYLHRFRKAPKHEQHVFLGRDRKPLTGNGLNQMLYKLRDRAHITGVRVSCHTFRHTYSVRYLQAGGDIYRLSRLLGHTSVSVTEEYLRAFKGKDARSGTLSVLDQLKLSV